MVKDATKEFVRNNRQLLRDVAGRMSSPIGPIAAAFLASVPPEDGETKSSERESPAGSKTESTERNEILPKRGDHL